MEHLRAQWRSLSKTASGRRTLYRGISLQGASARYAWGLDTEIVGKFSRAMKKGDHQAAAKVILDLCEQSGEFVEGGHFGVWWSTDLKVARGYAGMHTRETLGCVIYAEVDDEDINQGHAEQYGYTHESPVVLREGAQVDIVAIEVRYNPDLKVLRDGDFVKIPVRRTVTASLVRKTAGMIPATTSTNGPFRTVVDVEPTDRRQFEHWRKVADAFDDISLDAGDMRFYEWEGRQQKAVGGGRKINSASDAKELAAKVLPAYGIDPAKVSIRMEGWDSYTKLDGDRVEIKIGFGYSGDGATTAWNVLHELAHAILFLRGNTSHRHGPEFERLLLELIGKYTRVRGVTPHQSSVTTWRERVDALPESYTPAIMSAVENVYDQGYNEDDDEFWEQVYGEVMA